jgi:DNA-directed RNA polymerase II subunit RPB1
MLQDSNNVREIAKLKLGVMSPEQIVKMSVVDIYKPLSNDVGDITISNDTVNDRKNNTLSDLRMGTIDKKNKCSTCHQVAKNCPGHFGRMYFAKPVYQIHLIGQILKTLNCVCYRCSYILIDKSEGSVNLNVLKTKKSKNRLNFLTKTKKDKCFHCGAVQPKFSKDKDTYTNIIAEFSSKKSDKDENESSTTMSTKKNVTKKTISINVEYCLRILEGISNEDCELLGYDPQMSHPKWFIWTVMLIPPPAMRPTVKTETDKSSEDDLTHILNEIIKTNNILNSTTQGDSAIVNCWNNLQWHVAVYIDNDQTNIPKCTNRSGRALKTVRQRIIQKEGRVRGNLMGKRVDHSARTVITPDPLLEIDQLGVPYAICSNLIYPEIVTPYNIDKLYRLINNYDENNNQIYPSAKSIRFKGKGMGDSSIVYRELKYVRQRENIVLNFGDVVHRNLMKNDVVAFNRQPSLHKMSMMAHRVVPLKGHSFRFNPNVTAPYNADFDGDEMNMHVPLTIATVFELQTLMAIPTQIISPQASQPVMNLIQDSLLGMYRMTLRRSMKLTLKNYMTLLGTTNSYADSLIKGKSESNKIDSILDIKNLLSLILPEITKKFGSDNNSSTVITNSFFEDELIFNKETNEEELKKSIMDKGIVGKIIQLTFNFYGPHETARLFNKMNNLANQWLLIDGFSVGLSDILISDELNKNVSTIISNTIKESSNLVSNLYHGEMEQSHISNMEQFESKIMKTLLQSVEDITDKIVKTIKQENNKLGEDKSQEWNRFYSMIQAGSKGKTINMRQIIGCLGQQEIDGARIANDLPRRPLPHCYKDTLTPQQRGYVVHSYLEGLDPMEYFFHAQKGRTGIIATSIKTAESGYIQRRLEKAMEDANVRYDNTVRNANDYIIQIIYGNDGFDATHLIKVPIKSLQFSDTKFEKEFKMNSSELMNHLLVIDTSLKKTHLETDDTVKIYETMTNHYNNLYEIRNKIRKIYSNSLTFPSKVAIPLDIASFIQELIYKFNLHTIPFTTIDPIYICKTNDSLMEFIISKNHQESMDNMFCDISTLMFRFLVLTFLSPKMIINEYKLSLEAYDYLILEIRTQYLGALINPGEQIGSIAAQSIGEPTTQDTLDTFHNLGSATGKAPLTKGVVRLKEILNATKKLKTPSLKIYLEKNYLYQDYTQNDTKEVNTENMIMRAKNISNKLQYTDFKYYIKSTQFIYDPTVDVIKEDVSFLEKIKDKTVFRENPWTIRFVIDRDILYDQKIMLDQLVVPIYQHFSSKKSVTKGKQQQFIPHILFFYNTNYTENESNDAIIRISLSFDEDKQKSTYNKLINIEKQLSSIPIQGITDIISTHVSNESSIIYKDNGTIILPDTDEFEKEKKYNPHATDVIIETIGTNLIDTLNLENIDTLRTISNSIHEIYSVFGVEAARQSIIHEVAILMDDSKINTRHVSMLADVMTSNGIIVSVDRHGVNKSDNGPLARASFEETTLQLTNAAIYSEVDYMTGVSSNIMFGQFFKGGTNSFTTTLDENFLTLPPVNQYVPDEKFMNESEINEKLESIKLDTLCENDATFEFSYDF